MTLAKLGPHVINQTADGMEWVQVAPIAKSLGRVDTLQTATRAKVLILRHYFPRQDLYADPHDVADAILADLGGWRDPRLLVEVYNEIGAVESAAHLAFLQRVVPILHAAGVRVCGPCWATGDYEREHWELFRAAGWAGLDAVAVHGYWSHEKGPTVWNALRYRQFWQTGDPDVVNTECGEDRVRDGDDGEYIGCGWRLSGATEAEYLAEHVGYDAQLQQDAHCLGAVSFTCGPTSDWQNYNADPIARAAAALSGGGHMPNVGEGFRKCEPFVGPWAEDEVYHANGTDQKTSLAIGARGFAVWRAKTNETIAVTDAGEILADAGNHADGVLRRVRPPF